MVSRRWQLVTTACAALAGGAYWAGVRPSGYGSGPSMGLAWGMLWLLLVHLVYPKVNVPSKNVYILLAFVIGFSIGGMQGYGQFNQWVQGAFHIDSDLDITTPISPGIGLVHLFTCGLTWGGFPALLITWALRARTSPRDWITRAGLAVAGFVAVQALFHVFPQAFLPFYERGYYNDLATCPDCVRTIETARNTFGYLGSFVALAIHASWTDRRAGAFVLLVSLGFATSFSLGGLLHLGSTGPLDNLPWWKFWEFTCGFGGGLSLFTGFWYLEREGVLREQLDRDVTGKAPAVHHAFGFWIPLHACIAELGRDKLQQAGKIWKLSWGVDYSDFFFYAGLAFIAIIIVAFCCKVLACRGRLTASEGECLHVRRPLRFFLAIFLGFFCLSLLSWLRGPWDIVTYAIPLMTSSATALATVLLVAFTRHTYKHPPPG